MLRRGLDTPPVRENGPPGHAAILHGPSFDAYAVLYRKQEGAPMSQASLVEVERDGAVARVWLNRPEQHNALAVEVGAALVDALRGLKDDPRCRVVVFGGRGASFCAGADIAVMKASANASYEDNLLE